MLGHLSFGVADLLRTTAFYDATMSALGCQRVWTSERGVGYGPDPDHERLTLFLKPAPIVAPGPGFHLAFDAPDRASVDAFHAAALANGGLDNGAPGLRAHYGPHYYAAFVIDPDGYRLEVVHQRPPS